MPAGDLKGGKVPLKMGSERKQKKKNENWSKWLKKVTALFSVYDVRTALSLEKLILIRPPSY